MNASIGEPLIPTLFALAIPLSFGLTVPLLSARRPFARAITSAYVALALAVCTVAGALLLPSGVPQAPPRLAALVRLDGVTHLMLTLVCFVAVVIVRYSQTYLQGHTGRWADVSQLRYARALLATMAAVTALVLANNLLVLAFAWVGTSLGLHQLLTFYRERPQALVVAHKKFLLSRLADACILGALVLIDTGVGSLNLDAVNRWAEARAAMPLSMHVAAVLLVLAVSLKSAQLPFHGWLIQVMEAPTPVSALLHAGIVNIGGFVMIRLAPFMAHAPVAQALLVTIGTVTAVVAALVMTTRVSVKVALAWSTCAQMGFMLVECGLGAWHLALLHLVAHSLYKAYAFLGSGTAVDVWRAQSTATPRVPVRISYALGASALVFTSVAASVAAARAAIAGAGEPSGTLVPLTIVLGLSLAPLVVRSTNGSLRTVVGVALRGIFAGALFFTGHVAAGYLFPSPQTASEPGLWYLFVAAFAALFAVQMVLECRPQGRLARALQPRLFAGLYLDERFTRITFRLWPPRLTRREAARPRIRIGNTLEAQ